MPALPPWVEDFNSKFALANVVGKEWRAIGATATAATSAVVQGPGRRPNQAVGCRNGAKDADLAVAPGDRPLVLTPTGTNDDIVAIGQGDRAGSDLVAAGDGAGSARARRRPDQAVLGGDRMAAVEGLPARAAHPGCGTGGKQVHIGSVRTLLALRGRGYAAYCASKGGLATLCKQLAAEWAPHKINLNVVAPTFVRTPLVADMLSEPKFYNSLVARIPLGRIAEPDDVRNTVLFLVSPASDFITGQTIYLDGGITATQ